MSSKTRKNRKTNSNNKTRKSWHKTQKTEKRFKINSVEILGINGKPVRFERLKPGVTEFLPDYKPGDIRRVIGKGRDNWKPDDVIRFDYLFDKYKWQGNYKPTPEDEANINKLLKSKGIRQDDSTPTPPEETKKEIEKQEKQAEKEPEPEKEPEKEPEEEPEKEPEKEPEEEPEPELEPEVTEKKEL